MSQEQPPGPRFQDFSSRIRKVSAQAPRFALDQYAELMAAIRFLTILPAPDPERPARAQSVLPAAEVGSGYFPLVGLLLALLLWILTDIFGLLIPRLALAAVLVVALVLFTGGLHLDGLMDFCDGFFGGSTPERRLEIMRDSRVGSFGVLGGVSALLLKFVLFASLPGLTFIPALFIALSTSRWTMVLAGRLFPTARPMGLGATFRELVTSGRLILAALIALITALIAGLLAGLIAWIGATLITIAFGFWITRRLGGFTGDAFGAIEETAEITALLLLVIFQFWFQAV